MAAKRALRSRGTHVKHSAKSAKHRRCKCRKSCCVLSCPHACQACRPGKAEAPAEAAPLPPRAPSARLLPHTPGKYDERGATAAALDEERDISPMQVLKHMRIETGKLARISGPLGDTSDRMLRASLQAMREVHHRMSEICAPDDAVRLRELSIRDIQGQIVPPEQRWLTPEARVIVGLIQATKQLRLSKPERHVLIIALMSQPEPPTQEQLLRVVSVSTKELAKVRSDTCAAAALAPTHARVRAYVPSSLTSRLAVAPHRHQLQERRCRHGRSLASTTLPSLRQQGEAERAGVVGALPSLRPPSGPPDEAPHSRRRRSGALPPPLGALPTHVRA